MAKIIIVSEKNLMDTISKDEQNREGNMAARLQDKQWTTLM